MKNKFLATVFLTSFGICSLNAESIGMFEAYTMALNNSHEAKSLDYQLQADEELVSQAYSQILPQVTTQMAKINVKEKVNSKYSSVGQIEQDVIDKTINLSQVIFNADLFTRIDVEKSRVDIMRAEKGLQKQELAKKVFNGYLEILKSKNKIELNNSYLKYNEYNLLSMEKKHQMDLASKMDYLETKVEYNNARVELRKEEDLLNANILDFKNLIGTNNFELASFDTTKKINVVVDDINRSIANVDNMYSNMLIKKSESTAAFHKSEMNNAMSKHLPTFDFEASYSKYDIDNPSSDYNNDNKKQFMFVFRLPLFQGGYALSKTRESKMRYKSAMEDLEDIKAKTNIDYEKYKSVFDSSMKMLPLYQESLENAILFKESVEQGHTFGLKSIIDVYEANNKVYEIKYEYLDNLYELIDAYVNLLILTNNFDDLRMVDLLIAKY